MKVNDIIEAIYVTFADPAEMGATVRIVDRDEDAVVIVDVEGNLFRIEPRYVGKVDTPVDEPDLRAVFARTCDVCGVLLTDAERSALARDIDFVEHNGHTIRVVQPWAR